MIKCINSNIEIYSDDNYNYNNWNLINNKGIFNILNNTSNRVDFCILPSGNIGIGSTAPKSRLDVVGDVSIQGRTTINSNIIVASTLTTAPIAQFGTHANASSNIYLVGGARSRIGIGSASPTVALDVAGATNISGLITANGGLTIPTGRALNVLGEMNTGTINATNLNVAETISANGGIILPYGYAIIADGGIYTTFINATEIINATQGLIVSAGSLLTANGGISATTLTASGLITANNGLSIPTGKTLVANGSISTTTLEASSNIRVLTTTATAPIVQYGTNASAANNLYFVGGGRARIGIGSSSPTVALDVLGNANISATISATAVTTTAITTATINASAAISANSIASTTTILAGDLITANGGITVPLGKQVVANGGITATTISASGLITATNGIQANTINTTGAVNTNGGIISGSTITSSGLITANAGISASTITSLGIINAAAGISATTINASSAITGTTLEMSGLIRTAGGLDATTIIASGLLTANNGISASSITSTGTIIASTTTATTPIAQYGTNANAASNIYIVGGGNARVGIGSSSPTVALDVAGDTNISGALLAAAGISTTTIAAAQLITASNGISTTTLDVSNNLIVKSTIATTPITQIGDNASPSSNLYFVGGGRARVGIGSGSPTAALDIVGDTDITGIYKRNNRDVILDTSNYILATSNIIIRRLGDYIPYTWAINSQSFNLNYTLGNVGIGTTEPLKKLHIMHPSGELIRIETNAEGANQVSGIEFGIPSYNSASRSKITSTTYDDGAGAGAASDLQFSTASSANNSSLKFIITPTGNIGIGTPTPNNILQIGNAGRLRIANNISDYTIIGTADTDDTTNTKIELSGNTRSGTAGNISYVATNTDGYHKFITNSTAERVRITASGNVGIGTTNPSQLLTLYGNNAGLKIKNSAETTAANKSVAINLDNGNNDEWIIDNSNSSLAFAYNDGLATSNRMIIDGVSGNIGIGTNPATSNYKLNILGNIKVAGNLIPDTSNTYNLGSPLNKWKDLYLSGNSIYLDDLVLSKGSNISLNITDLQGNYRDVNLSCINLFSQSNISNSSNSSFTSNRLTIGIDANGNITYTTSNKIFYPLTTPNINNTAILDNVNEIIITTSNFAINTSNKLTNIINTLDNSQSNYVLTTSNLISQRITDLRTDMITEDVSASNKFIVNNIYNNNLEVNGNLTINSNLIVLGDTTRLDTVAYTTERLEVVNANITTTAFMVQQKTNDRDIFVASNMNAAVFRIANNGDVLITGNGSTGVYKRNNRDVIWDTSNYVLNASNMLIAKVRENDLNSSNYVMSASNNLINKVKENDLNSSNYVMSASNNLINKVKENDLNSSNYVMSASNNLINKVKENDENTAGKITLLSNTLLAIDRLNDDNASNYVMSASNNLINKMRENDLNSSNYVSAINNNLTNQITELNNTQNTFVILASSNLGEGLTEVVLKMSENDRNASNYIRTTSNIIQRRINEITTDKIVEGVKNKFIIDDRYNSNLEINGRLVVNSNLVVNSLATMRNSLDITGNVNFTGELYKNGMLYPNGKTYTGSSSILSQYSPIQTQFTMYKDVVEKTGGGWQFIDNNINVVDDKVQGFCVRIKPNHYTSKILINLNCHIGIDYGTDARWWGLRLYRKIGEAGAWEHITDADGTSGGSSGSGNGTTCWLSHNLGAETSSSSYLIANMSGAYYDTPMIVNTEADGAAAAAAANYIYYTVKWCSLLGDNTQDGKLYLNRPAVINALNAPIVSSSWNISEIWQLETSYFPKGGIVTKYTPTQTQFSIYKEVVEKTGGGWNFIDNNTSIIDNNIQGFCVRIMPNHYTSKILINLNCHIGIDYGTDARWWGLRLYRKIGEAGAWEHITDANGNNSGSSGSSGTPCWLSHNLGAEASTYSYFIANVSGAYYDTPNVMDTFVYYTAMWCSQLGDMSQNGKLYLNRPATYNTANTANTAVLSSSWNAQEIWQRETTFIPKNAVICQNMSIQTLFNIYRNIVVKSGSGWRFIDNNTSIIGDKIQGFCVRIKPTHPSSKVLVHLSCHIGIDYGTDARWWGLRLYRKIGEAGAWTHITGADGNNLIDNKGTSCWLSHNLGAESSTSSYFVANISGSFFDLPATSTEFVYYTAMWCSQLGDNSLEGKIYLNRPATYNEDNSAVLSSSWNAQEIWQLGTPYEPAEYSIINIFNNNNVGIGTTNPVCKLDVNGTINAVNYSTISDRRYKKDIKDIDSSLELINRLSPVSYLTINQSEGDRRNYGFIAQDLHKVIPEAVNVPANDSNNYTIEYMSLIPLLTKSIQDLTKTVEDLTKTVGRQQKTIEDLTASHARHILLQDTLI